MKKEKGGIFTKKNLILISFLLILFSGPVFAGGPSGMPEPVSRDEGGLHTAIGYWLGQTKYENSTSVLMRQNQIYSEAGYGFKKYADIYARVGISDFKISDVFRSQSSATSTYKNDFKDRWNFFGTLGAKGFYSINNIFGVGAFIQGTYYFGNFHDKVSGIEDGKLFVTELKLKNLWDVSGGFGLQITAPLGIKLYAGPYGYYSETTAYPQTIVAGFPFASGKDKIKSKTNWGGYGGLFVPLGKGFGLNIEGQYSERFSAGAAVTYRY